MLRISIAFSIFFTLFSCQRDYHLDIEDRESQMVVEGILSVQNGAEVYLNRTINIGDTVFYDNAHFVAQANIEVVSKELGVVDTLLNIEDGKYIASKINYLVAGGEYKLRISHRDYDLVESAWVLIPEPFLNFDLQTEITEESIEIKIRFDASELIENISYTFGYLNSPAKDNIDFEYTSPLGNCEQIFFPLRRSTSVFDRDCFDSTTNRYSSRYTYFDSIEGLEFNAGIISYEALKYFNSINNQPIGIDQLFTSPLFTDSNIKGGIGFLAGYNEITVPIK